VNIIDVVQGTPQWLKARIGLPTASRFDAIVTPKTLKPSASAEKYLSELLAGWCLGALIGGDSSGFMERGTEMEAEAVGWYEFEHELETRPVGLCVTDCGRIGASPDRLAGPRGMVEIKCPSAHVHFHTVRHGFDDAHRMQTQGQLWVTRLDWVDLVSYHPVFPKVVVRILPDPAVFAAFDEHLWAFAEKLDTEKERFKEYRQVAADHLDAALAADTGHGF
jgi:hypothetical protein